MERGAGGDEGSSDMLGTRPDAPRTHPEEAHSFPVFRRDLRVVEPFTLVELAPVSQPDLQAPRIEVS